LQSMPPPASLTGASPPQPPRFDEAASERERASQLMAAELPAPKVAPPAPVDPRLAAAKARLAAAKSRLEAAKERARLSSLQLATSGQADVARLESQTAAREGDADSSLHPREFEPAAREREP
jgi:hypothetical protein